MPDHAHRLERTTHPLARTVPEGAFSREGLDRHVAAETPPAARDAGAPPPAFDRAAVPTPGETPGPRYHLREMLGVGATGRVYAVLDRNLDRPVAAKVLSTAKRSPEEVAAFVHEARVTASLAHPNVLPVHELDVDARGDVYFTTKRIEGRSLAEIIEASRAGARAAEIADAGAIAAAFVGVCQALAYAHHRGIVHQDVKPANIMLGAFGEVLLVDWGSAARLENGAATRLYGTPLYMSPEQARREPVDARTDVYSLGATLFHALTLRVPTWHDDLDEFWRMKRDGRFAPPRDEERAGMPAALVDIALKAIAPRREDRYADAEAMLADLRAFQSGLAVSAHRDGVLERFARWHRRHARALWTTIAVAAVVLVLAGALLGERLKEMATWGSPILVERFDDGWRGRWLPWEGEMVARDGALVAQGPREGSVILDRRLSGAIAVECEACSLPGFPTGDLSLLWCQDIDRRPDGRVVPRGQIFVQFGAHGGYESVINSERYGRVAFADRGLVAGRRYRVRMEIVGDRMALLVDGREVCSWIAPQRFDGGYVGIYSYFGGKSFRALKVMTRTAERVPATAIGDAFVTAGDDERAAEQYELLIAGHAGSGVEREARFKAGCCRWRQRREAEAEALWAPLAGTEFAPRVALERIDRLHADQDHADVLAGLDRLLDGAAPDVRALAAMRWSQYEQSAPDDQLERYLDLHDRRLAGERSADAATADALLRLGRTGEVRRRFPRQRQACAVSLLREGAFQRVVDEYPEQVWERVDALYNLGRFAEIDTGFSGFFGGRALIASGRAEEAVARCADDDDAMDRALCTLGRFDALVRREGGSDGAMMRVKLLGDGSLGALRTPWTVAFARVADGGEATPEELRPDANLGGWVAYAVGVSAWARGDREAARARFAPARRPCRGTCESWSLPALLEPFLAGVDGDWSAFDASLADLVAHGRDYAAQQPWFAASWLRGEIDDAAFLAQPFRAFAPAQLDLMRAMRAERSGERDAARAAWQAWLDLPRWRRWYDVRVAWERLARWRVAALAR